MIVALSVSVAYLILLGIVLHRRTRRNPAEGWLIGYCIYSAILMGFHALIVGSRQGIFDLPVSDQWLIMGGFIISVILTGTLTLSYLALSSTLFAGWTALSLVWALAVVAAEVTQAPNQLGEQAVLLPFSHITLSLEILFFGWLVLAVTLFALVARAFLSEPLPLYANRILFWYIVIPFLLLGDALAAWVDPPWSYLGYGLRLLGAISAVYAVVSHRIFDLRDSVRRFISFIILTVVTSALILGGIIAAFNMPAASLTQSGMWLVAIGVSFAVALLMQPVRQFFNWLLRRLIERDRADIAEAVRQYSQRVGGLLDLNEFATAATRAADELLGARRGCLIMTIEEGNDALLEMVGTDRVEQTKTGRILITSPIYQRFASMTDPILQYDIDYQKEFHGVSAAERKYFSGLQMDIFAPIVKDHKLIGILALGPKLNDDPYHPSEIELISALASQTVTALENARLVTDLRSLNAEISSLNQDLQQTNQRLERLDLVKSDFISIASHELRTPLTQIQGYADLLMEMSERNLLSPEQMVEITVSLRQASQRMGEVISSMLDVSQIDVENMDLSFVETSLASIIKLAIEPYSDAIHQRNLTLVARGLRNLPPVYGDYKRLVQAFEALITNAIKFTPDGGKINVSGEVFEKDTRGQPKSIRITVEDTGIGIDKEHHELIFEKFYRVGPTALHSTGATKFKGAGPGLGLPIARGIIQGHGGRIWVESEGCDEEKLPGAKFHVVLPVQPATLTAKERIQQFHEVVQGAEGKS